MSYKSIFIKKVSIPFKVIAVLLGLSFLSSCFHKDVLTDRPDNVISSMIYQGEEGNYVICKEAIFQANSKSSKGGFTQISGYNEYRISSYDIQTGKLSARVNMEKGMADGEFIILGETKGKIWIYSINKDLGLHYRNPKTLEVIANQEKIAEASSLKTITLPTPSWNDLSQYFTFDLELNKPIVTDAEGFTYYIDPTTFAIEKTNKKFKTRFSAHYFTNNGDIEDDKRISLIGDTRRIIQLANQPENGNELSFLFGEFILDNSPYKEGLRRRKYMGDLMKQKKELEDSVKLFENTHKKTSRGDYYDFGATELDEEAFDNYRNYTNQKGKIESLKRDSVRPQIDSKTFFLSNEPATALIYHANIISDTSKLILSKIKLDTNQSIKELWKCKLDNFYYSPSKADRKGAFNIVFSTGDPDFSYQWFDIIGDKLIFISQLQMACIDMKTGKLLWELNI